jgi:hypothetical protein
MALRVSALLHCIALLTLGVLACAGGSMDYNTADPVADARAALEAGNFHLVAVKLGDSTVSPIDSAYEHVSINVEVGPDGPIRYLDLVEDPDAPRQPSRAQMSYMKRFNTEMFRMLEENARPPRRS